MSEKEQKKKIVLNPIKKPKKENIYEREVSVHSKDFDSFYQEESESENTSSNKKHVENSCTLLSSRMH